MSNKDQSDSSSSQILDVKSLLITIFCGQINWLPSERFPSMHQLCQESFLRTKCSSSSIDSKSCHHPHLIISFKCICGPNHNLFPGFLPLTLMKLYIVAERLFVLMSRYFIGVFYLDLLSITNGIHMIF